MPILSRQTFLQNQKNTLEEGRSVYQQIKILKKFLSLYGNSSLIESSKKYSLLVAEKDEKIRSVQKTIREDSSLNEVARRTKEWQLTRDINREYQRKESKLAVEPFFSLAKELVQDIADVKSKEAIFYLCQNCFNVAYENDEAYKWRYNDPLRI